MGTSTTFQQSDIFTTSYLADCPGCGQQFDIRPRQGAYRGGRHRKYCSDRCRKTTKRRDERLQASLNQGQRQRSTPFPDQSGQAQKTMQQQTEVSSSPTGQPGPGHGQEWWYLIEDAPGGVGQIGPLIDTQARRLLERLRSVAATATTPQTTAALPALYHAPSMAVALSLHHKRTGSGASPTQM